VDTEFGWIEGFKNLWGGKTMTEPVPIFSGDASVEMWERINSAKTVEDVRWALYQVCCRLQELEARVNQKGGCNEGR
jgi:hypothetical protein